MFNLQESISHFFDSIPFVWMSPLQLVDRLSTVFDTTINTPSVHPITKTVGRESRKEVFFPIKRKVIEPKDHYSLKNKTVEEKIKKQESDAQIDYEREKLKQFFPPSLKTSLPIYYEKTKKSVVGSFIGRRKTQEDTFSMTRLKVNEQWLSFYAVYDGHAGHFSSNYLKTYLHQRLQENLEGFSTEEEFIDLVFHTFAEVNEEIKQKENTSTSRFHPVSSGSTAICAIIWNQHLYLFNTGDSCGLLLNRKNGEIKPLNTLARPDAELFSNSVRKKGGDIVFGKIYTTLASGRIMQLSVARAFGDPSFSCISSRPKLVKASFDQHSVLFLSCDGLLETMSRCTLGEKTIELLNRPGGNLQKSIQTVIEAAYHSGSNDNLTLLLAELG